MTTLLNENEAVGLEKKNRQTRWMFRALGIRTRRGND